MISNGKIDSYYRAILILWSVIAAFYGLNHYFSLNGDLNNPIVHPMVPVVKDIIWLCVLASMISISLWNSDEYDKTHSLPFGIATIHVVFAAVVMVLLAFMHSTIFEYNYLRFFKNMVLYTALAYVFAIVVYRRGMHHYFLRIMFYCITASLLVAVALHFTIETLYKSSDPRMFGTYGNPNAVGFMSLLNIALIYVFGTKNSNNLVLARPTQYLALIGSFAAHMLSASFSALLATVMYFIVVRIVHHYFVSSLKTPRIPVIKAGIFATIVVTVWSYLSGVPVALFGRIASLFLWKWPESVTVRVHDYAEVTNDSSTSVLTWLFGVMPSHFTQFDASLLTYYYHFGLIGVIVLALPFMAIFWKALALKGLGKIGVISSNAQLVYYVLPALLIFYIVSIPLQHQYQLFPTNYFYSVVTGLMMIICSKMSSVQMHKLFSSKKISESATTG